LRIENDNFAQCRSLRSFEVPSWVEVIGHNCFEQCGSLIRHRFRSGETLKNIDGAFTLDESLEDIGFSEISSLFIIEVDDRAPELEFSGLVFVTDGAAHLTLIHGF
jgi:hypothetical protein